MSKRQKKLLMRQISEIRCYQIAIASSFKSFNCVASNYQGREEVSYVYNSINEKDLDPFNVKDFLNIMKLFFLGGLSRSISKLSFVLTLSKSGNNLKHV